MKSAQAPPVCAVLSRLQWPCRLERAYKSSFSCWHCGCPSSAACPCPPCRRCSPFSATQRRSWLGLLHWVVGWRAWTCGPAARLWHSARRGCTVRTWRSGGAWWGRRAGGLAAADSYSSTNHGLQVQPPCRPQHHLGAPPKQKQKQNKTTQKLFNPGAGSARAAASHIGKSAGREWRRTSQTSRGRAMRGLPKPTSC